jgi:serine protease
MDAAHPELAERGIAAVDHGGAQPDSDKRGHGTHVAGLACATADNGLAIASAGFRCGLIVEKLEQLPGGGLTVSSLIAAVVDAANRDADAINMSLGGPTPDPDLRDALRYAWASGSIPVASAANQPSPGPHYPAQYVQPAGSGPNLAAGMGLVVTSASHARRRSSFAEGSAGVSVAAFGSATDSTSGGQQGIVSTWPGGPVQGDVAYPGTRTSIDGDDRYAYLVGTSMAAPQVAGLVALIRSVRPMMRSARVVRLVKLTADGRGDYGRGLGWGILDAYAALAGALRKDIVPPASLVSRDGGRFRVLAKTVRRRLSVRLRRGHGYRFYSRALDRVGNREAAPATADAGISL